MEFILLALIFVGIVCFKLHNVINSNEERGQRKPQRQQEIAAVVCWLSQFKGIYAWDREIQKCNIRDLSAPVTSIASCRLFTGHWVALSSLSAQLKTFQESAVLWTQSPHDGWRCGEKTCLTEVTPLRGTLWVSLGHEQVHRQPSSFTNTRLNPQTFFNTFNCIKVLCVLIALMRQPLTFTVYY